MSEINKTVNEWCDNCDMFVQKYHAKDYKKCMYCLRDTLDKNNIKIPEPVDFKDRCQEQKV